MRSSVETRTGYGSIEDKYDAHQHIVTDTHATMVFPALKLYLEITASSLSSLAVCCPYFHHFISGKLVSYPSCCLPSQFALPCSIYLSTLKLFFRQYNNTWGTIGEIESAVMNKRNQCCSQASYSIQPYAFSFFGIVWVTRSCAPIPPCSNTFIHAFKCDHNKLPFKMPDSDKKKLYQWKLFISFPETLTMWGCVHVWLQ